MTYLELSPAITALRSRPEEFELRDDALHHLGSRHSFRFLSDGELRIEALCGCSQLRALPQQSRALHEAFQRSIASSRATLSRQACSGGC